MASKQQMVLNGEDSKPLVAQDSGPLALIDKAVDKGLSAEAIAKLWEIQKDIDDRTARNAFVEAMNLFKRNAPRIQKTKTVAYKEVRFKHAELDKACDQIVPALSAVGISHRWETKQESIQGTPNQIITVTCVLTHELGHSERTVLQGLPDDSGSKNKIQAVGSTVTYLERYTLLAAVGLAAENQDDDGAGSDEANHTLADLQDHLDKIRSGGPKEFMRFYFEALEAAKKVKDEDATRALQAAKDARKKELGL